MLCTTVRAGKEFHALATEIVRWHGTAVVREVFGEDAMHRHSFYPEWAEQMVRLQEVAAALNAFRPYGDARDLGAGPDVVEAGLSTPVAPLHEINALSLGW